MRKVLFIASTGGHLSEILKLDKKPKTTPNLFKEVCKLLELDENNMLDMIGDFYTTLTTDKRFLLLEDAKWDLKEFHSVKPVVDEEDEEVTEEEEEAVETEDDIVTKDDDYDINDSEEDDLEDLAIISEEEMDE